MTITNSDLSASLHRLTRLMHRMAHQTRPHRQGLYHGQAHLLLHISQNDGVVQRDLAEQLDVRPSSLTEMLVKMEQLGLVQRRSDENDQRLLRIYLTEAGKEAAAELLGTVNDWNGTLFDCLEPTEREQLQAILAKLAANLETLGYAGAGDGERWGWHEGHHHGPADARHPGCARHGRWDGRIRHHD
jgi:DNA-binding MarR family transcriptional regulator